MVGWEHNRGDENDVYKKFDKDARIKFNALPTEKKTKSLNAKTFILYPFELKYNQNKTFEEKELDSLKLIETHLKDFKKPYVATSFGNDSIVLMHLVIQVCKKLDISIPDMFLNDTLNTFKEEKQYWSDMIKYFDLGSHFKLFTPPKDKTGKQQTVWTIAKKVGHLPSFRGTHIEYGSKGRTPECCDILKKASMKNYMKHLPESERYDCQFVGTRAEESRMRAMSVLQRCRTYIVKTFVNYPMRVVTPLSYWTFDDISKYYEKYNIPKNPTYEAHNIERMGCASCPAHKNWEIRLAKDPTNEGFGMLEMNLKILKDSVEAGTENPIRLTHTIKTIKKYMKSKTITDINVKRLTNLLGKYEY